ncbi:SOS response-associated peptidase family protein, partial [Nocardia cyriacigeorgica]|uniref:SOS response-associated peptidase family protein n=1 Tax=Nocardia cyriacigeorgica TaxID=135487 RepID=UPI0024540CD1
MPNCHRETSKALTLTSWRSTTCRSKDYAAGQPGQRVARHDTPTARGPVRPAIHHSLIPHWTKAAEPGVPVKGKPLFNARADKAATTPSFRDAGKYRRCLV